MLSSGSDAYELAITFSSKHLHSLRCYIGTDSEDDKKYKNQRPALTIFAEVVFTKYALANCVQIRSDFSKHLLRLAIMNEWY